MSILQGIGITISIVIILLFIIPMYISMAISHYFDALELYMKKQGELYGKGVKRREKSNSKKEN